MMLAFDKHVTFKILIIFLLLYVRIHAVKQRHPNRQHRRFCAKYANCSSSVQTRNETPKTKFDAATVHNSTIGKHYEVSPDRPIYVLFPLPTTWNDVWNPFSITLQQAQPVVDEALEEVYFKRQLLKNGSLVVSFEDTHLSDAHGPNVAIKHLVQNTLDCIIGYGFVYSLAAVARMSPYWQDADSDGIPVITSIGLASNLDNRREYQLMTRISPPYKMVQNAAHWYFERMKWRRSFFIIQQYARGAREDASSPFSEWHFLAIALNQKLRPRFVSDYHMHAVISGEPRPSESLCFLQSSYCIKSFLPVRSQQTNTTVQSPSKRLWPFDVLIVLPAYESHNDKFGLTIAKAEPVVEIAVEDVVRLGILPDGWVRLRYEDSRFWEDATLAERHAVNAVVHAHCENRLDAVVGFADDYSCATTAKITAGFNKGIPVITTTGLNSQLGYKRSFPYLIRMQGTYRQIAQSMFRLLAYNEEETNSTSLNYRNFVFFYHDKRRAVNRPEGVVNGEDHSELTSSQCYFSLYATKNYFVEKSAYFKLAWISQASHLAFDEELNHTRADIHKWLKKAAESANAAPDSSSIREANAQSVLMKNVRLPQRSYRLFPLDIVVGLPQDEGSTLRNPFRLNIGKSQPIFDVAVEDIEKRQLLPAGALRVTYEDTQLSDAIGPQKFVDHYCQRTIDAAFAIPYVFGLAPVARMSPFWGAGVPVFTTTAMVDELGDRETFPLLTRLMGTYRTLAKMVYRMVEDFKWSQFHFFFNDQAVHGTSHGRSECYFSLNAIKNVFNNAQSIQWTVTMFGEQTTSRAEFGDLLRKASMLTNMIILCASPDTVREIMLAAYDLGMAQSGDYLFINIDVSTGSVAEKPWLRLNTTNIEENERENRNAREAYRALKTISLRRSDLDEYKNFESRVKERAEKKYNYSLKAKKEYEMNNFISAFYDAVLLYAIALNETLAEGLDPRNGRNITSKMWNRTFVGITGNVSIDQNGDRYSDYSLLDLDPDRDRFVEVAYYSGASNELKQMTDFHWVGGKPPKDSPVCGYDHSKCIEGYPAHVYALAGAAVIICIMAFGFFFFWRRYKLEAELAAMSWRIRWEELDGDELRKEKKKNQKRARKSDIYNQVEQTEALLRSNSRSSINSDKRSSSSGATRKISAMIDRKLSVFTRKKSTPSGDKQLENNHTGFATVDEERNISSPSNSNSTKKKSSTEDDYEAKKSISLKNRKFSMTLSMKSGGSVETIQMQNNAQIFTRTASYRGTMVAIKMLRIDPKRYPKLELSRTLLMEFKKMKDLQHDHITRFAGACVDPPHYCIVTEYCPKGSLEDILENEKIRLDRMMKISLLHDLVKGCYFLHNSEVKFHGRLKTSNCVVDGRFVLKVTDFGLLDLRAMEEVTAEDLDSHAYYRKLLWTAPEILRESNNFTNVADVLVAHKSDTKMMQKADLYSFALILHEMLFRRGAFYRGEDENPEPKDNLQRVCAKPKSEDDLYRPLIVEDLEEEAQNETLHRLMDLMVCCWAESPENRLDFRHIRSLVHQLNKDNETANLVDNLLKRMEQYATNLEGLVEERTQEYLAEKKKVEELLHQLLPPSVADQLMSGHAVEPESYDSVSIYFSDIVGFTDLSSQSTPMQIVTLLNDLYMAFDSVVDNFKVYKVETIGDAYMVVSGLPERREDHASQIAQMSLALLHKVKNFTIKHRPNEQLKLRIGIHSGSVAAGVVGSKMPRYCLFGDTVNMASRMESNGMPLRIHVSNETNAILSADEGFHLTCRGTIMVKGKGQQTTYWLKRYKSLTVPDFGPEFNDD
ncbi:Guanylate cyclase [Aphelenchoides besseyi]|nr:Guanylate cyclase [Aphelenchoides besseyi]